MKLKSLYLTIALACVSLTAVSKGDVTKEKFTPFYTKDIAPRMENVLPNPPELTDSRFFYDWTQYQWGKSIRSTERGQQAVADAGIGAKYFMERFGAVMGRTLTPEKYPEMYRLMSRLHLTEQQAGASAKAHFRRLRPYHQYKEPTGLPSHERADDFTSYPSGHTHASWLVGMMLTSVDPAHTEEIMKVAYELGQSRVILGYHYQSDVDAGRIVGSITFARLCAEEEFCQMLQKVKKEYAKNAE